MPNAILGDDGYWRTMELVNGQPCVRVIGEYEPLLASEIEISFDEPRAPRVTTTRMDETALADLVRRCKES